MRGSSIPGRHHAGRDHTHALFCTSSHWFLDKIVALFSRMPAQNCSVNAQIQHLARLPIDVPFPPQLSGCPAPPTNSMIARRMRVKDLGPSRTLWSSTRSHVRPYKRCNPIDDSVASQGGGNDGVEPMGGMAGP